MHDPAALLVEGLRRRGEGHRVLGTGFGALPVREAGVDDGIHVLA